MTKILGIGLVAALLTAGCATAPTEEAKLAASNAAKRDAAKAFCVQDTGTRIKHTKDQCLQSGRTYSRDELEGTGAFDAAEALRRLDPRL
jgi:hypothetical protein